MNPDDPDDAAMLRRIAATTASSLAAVANELARRHPAHPAEATPVAGGWLVLTGPGSYVNRLVGGGIDRPLDAHDVAYVIDRSADVGVTPQVEVTHATHPRSVALLGECGFEPAASSITIARWNGARRSPPSDDIRTRVLASNEFGLWQELTARGWGHADPTARRISDEFTEAVAALDGHHLLVATSATDGRPLGCASLSTHEAMATLGGMSTLPDERRRGVQTALVGARIDLALDQGCDLIVATAATGSASERNLVRVGFDAVSVLTTHELTKHELMNHRSPVRS